MPANEARRQRQALAAALAVIVVTGWAWGARVLRSQTQSLRGNDFFGRIRLWATDPQHYPTTHYVRAVPRRVLHAYTAVQLACLAALWWVKASRAGIMPSCPSDQTMRPEAKRPGAPVVLPTP